jgi:putative transposase
VGQEENSTTLVTLRPLLQQQQQSLEEETASATLKSLVPTNKQISTDRSKPSESNTQPTPSLPTSDQASTSTAKDFLPYWNGYTQELSQQLSLHTATACAASDLSWSSGSSARLAQQSWFRVKSSKIVPRLLPLPLPTLDMMSDEPNATSCRTTSLPSLPILWQEITVDAQQKTDAREELLQQKKEENKLRKLRINQAGKEATEKRQTERKEKAEKVKAETIEQAEISVQPPNDPDVLDKPNNNKKTSVKRKRSEKPVAPGLPPRLKKPVIVSDPDKPTAESVNKIKLNSTADQLDKMRQVFGVATWTYNQCVDVVCRKKTHKATVKELRAYCVTASAPLLQDKPWVTAVPYDIRDEAVKDFVQAFKTCKTKVRKGDLAFNGFHFKFQSKHNKSRKIVIHAKHYWAAGLFHPAFFGKNERFRSFKSDPLPERLEYDCALTLNWLGHLHLHVLKPLNRHTDRPPAPFPIVSIDPGVRTFGTCYDPAQQRLIEWGVGDIGRIMRLCLHMDDLQSRIYADKGKVRQGTNGAAAASTNVGHKKRCKMKRALRRMSQRIQNWTRDFHYRFGKWLCENYRVILLPYYKVTEMVIKQNTNGRRRNIASKTVRAMLNWSPCLFRDRLLAMSRRYPGCHVVQLSEAWTSKTCRGCGSIHHTLGGNHTFRCPTCHIVYSRDEGGACNILLRHATMLHDDAQRAEMEEAVAQSLLIDVDAEDDDNASSFGFACDPASPAAKRIRVDMSDFASSAFSTGFCVPVASSDCDMATDAAADSAAVDAAYQIMYKAALDSYVAGDDHAIDGLWAPTTDYDDPSPSSFFSPPLLPTLHE